jgi:hypothetical protein
VPRATQCLEGCWASCRRQSTAIHPRGRATTNAPGRISPSEGENTAWCTGHGPPAQADGRGPPPAAGPSRHVVLCGHRIVFSSPPGRRMFRLLTFFHEPSLQEQIKDIIMIISATERPRKKRILCSKHTYAVSVHCV